MTQARIRKHATRTAALLLLPLLIACTSEVPEHKALATANYFPESFFQPSQMCEYGEGPKLYPIIDDRNRYPKYWRAAGEPSLFELAKQRGAADKLVIRFTELPSFDHPIVIRMERYRRGFLITATKLSGAGGYYPGESYGRVRRTLTGKRAEQFEKLLRHTRIVEQSATQCDIGFDGSSWIIEIVDRNGYHYINRWSPDSGPVLEVGQFMMKAIGWQSDR